MAEDENKGLKFWQNVVSNSAGNTVAGLIGLNMPDPTGVVLSSIAGPVVTNFVENAANDFQKRMLSTREKIRVGSVLCHFVNQFNENADAGMKTRTDDFTNSNESFTSYGEVFEGVLQSAQKSYLEKKVKHLGFFAANILVETRWDSNHAARFLKVAENLSYFQFCAIALYRRADKFGLEVNPRYSTRILGHDVIGELIELKNLGILGLNLPLETGNGKVFHFPPNNAFLSEYGAAFFDLFGFAKIPLGDLLDAAKKFVDHKLIDEIRKNQML